MGWNSGKMTLRVHKHLLTPEERASIVCVMRAHSTKSARAWAAEFRRLPATIAKIADAEGIALRND